MILPAQTIRRLCESGLLVQPFHERATSHGMTYGLSPAGYDVRIAHWIGIPPGGFALASTMERFVMPDDVIAFVHDKSTWARRGIALQNTVIEPGWIAQSLTLEISNHGNEAIVIEERMPIAQIVFHRLEEPTYLPYRGKYQHQGIGPQAAILE